VLERKVADSWFIQNFKLHVVYILSIKVETASYMPLSRCSAVSSSLLNERDLFNIKIAYNSPNVA
jgi:hypothetical protein